MLSLINKDNNSLKIECPTPERAVFGHSDLWIQRYGIYLVLSSNSNVNTKSCSNQGKDYNKHPSYVYGSTEAKEFLAGSEEFKTLDIEMYIKQA